MSALHGHDDAFSSVRERKGLKKTGFEGWYFRQQGKENTLALIPGQAEDGAFLQIVLPDDSRQIFLPFLTVQNGEIRSEGCRFSRQGCQLDLPGIHGELHYKALTPLHSDIMGPFRFFPMECRHAVISMAHTVSGCLFLDGQPLDFTDGRGYIEKDSGISFPRSYLWLQCNDFEVPLSLMFAIADIPFCGGRFTGCIGSLIDHSKEYRFATYRGVRIREYRDGCLCLSQGRLCVKADIQPKKNGCALRSPRQGKMSGCIHECNNARLRIRLWDGDRLILDQTSRHAAYEFSPPPCSSPQAACR